MNLMFIQLISFYTVCIGHTLHLYLHSVPKVFKLIICKTHLNYILICDELKSYLFISRIRNKTIRSKFCSISPSHLSSKNIDIFIHLYYVSLNWCFCVCVRFI